MNEELMELLLGRQHVPTPGDSTHLNSLWDYRSAIEIAVLHHHRFAFYYWLKWATFDWNISLSENTSPSLITIDYHDDVGGECDCDPDELRLLVERLEVDDVDDQRCLDDAIERRRRTENNVTAFTFLGLRALNDGHIYPAQYLNAISDVYVLYKDGDDHSYETVDQFGNPHETHYCTSPEKLVESIQDSDCDNFYFDLDVDYFFEPSEGGERGSEIMVNEREIRSFLDPERPLMSEIFERNIKGMTFALEPTYCGGLVGCFEAMSLVHEAFFTGSLLGHDFDWNSAVRNTANQ